jgi:hypothetical protein
MSASHAVAFGALILALGEAVLLSFWVPAVYRAGLRVFRRVVPLEHLSGLDELDLHAKFTGGFLAPRLAFHRLSEREIAFQEASSLMGGGRSIPVMKGLIEWRPEQRDVRVLGILLWYPIIGVLAFVTLTWPAGREIALGGGLILVVAWAVLLAIQWSRFQDVAAVLEKIGPGTPP